MMGTCKYWFRYYVAPAEVLRVAEKLREDGDEPRKNSLGETVVSEMFLMHCEAATVCLQF